MPEHTTFLHYLLVRLGLTEPLQGLPSWMTTSVMDQKALAYRDLEPLVMALIVMVGLLMILAEVRRTLKRLNVSTVPEDKLTVRTFFEVFFSLFYGIARDAMGDKNAKKHFPLIGSLAIFIFVSNCLGLIPGFSPPTSSWDLTIGMALLVFLLFNYYGIKAQGIGYFKHMMAWGTFKGFVPSLLLGIPLLFIETISLCVRPVTLSFRLMLNMSVDHVLVGIFFGLFALFVPLPLFFLGIIIICVQTLVFVLLTCVYIGLATEVHEEGHH